MADDKQRILDAIQLLRQLVNQAMVEKGLDDEQDVVDVTVVPATSQIDLSTARYNAAIEQLLEADALVRDHETDHLLGKVNGEPEAFKIMSGGPELLRKTGM